MKDSLVAIVLCLGVLSACQPQPEDTGDVTTAPSPQPQTQTGLREGEAPQPDAETGRFLPSHWPVTPERIDRLEVPEGFEISVFARNLGSKPRMLLALEGMIYITRPERGDVLALRDTNYDGRADSRKVVVSGLTQVHGVAVRDNRMYLATPRSVYAAPVEADGDIGEPRRIAGNLPPGGRHPYRTLGFGPEGDLYVSVGSTCNACVEKNPESAAILRINPETGEREVFARGLRNTIGFGWHPRTQEMWGMDIGTDWLGADIPPEELNNLSGGGDFGWPWCYGRRTVDQEMLERRKERVAIDYCTKTEPAALTYQAHSSPIAMVFYDEASFPAEYRGDAFIALHGSWNRKPAVGFKVARINFENGQPIGIRDFMTGFLVKDAQAFFGRPAGLAVTANGDLLVSDDANGVIYQVSYTGS